MSSMHQILKRRHKNKIMKTIVKSIEENIFFRFDKAMVFVIFWETPSDKGVVWIWQMQAYLMHDASFYWKMAFIGFLEGPGWLDDVTKVMEPRQGLLPHTHSLCDNTVTTVCGTW